MNVPNAQVATIFDEIADWLELDNANSFRIRAYRNAARTISDLIEPLSDRKHRRRELFDLPGIGEDLSAKIDEILRTGSCTLLRELRRRHPHGLTALLGISGIGPRRASRLYKELGVTTPKRLLEAARAGKIRTLPGFGARSETAIREAVATHLASEHRWKRAAAIPYANAIGTHLRQLGGVGEVVVAGSYRRLRDTVGDLDVLVSSIHRGAVIDRFTAYFEVKRVLARGPTKASMTLSCGLQVDLRVVRPESFGAALIYFTGSKEHNLALRVMAQKRGLKINEYGVYRDARRIAGESEESVYASVSLPLIPPELRENRGEIEAAKLGMLPKLVMRDDLQGDLHAHTNVTGGCADMADMARAAQSAGLKYLAITDHSKHLTGGGLNAKRLIMQGEAIDRFNDTTPGVILLKGIEVEILEDGSLDLPDTVLSRLDLVVAAIHSHFELSRVRQTERILRAMDHPHFSILAHPTGRLIGQRSAYDIDINRVLRHAHERGCFLELNAQPDRLDLHDVHCRMAKNEGVLLAISSDAHDISGFAALEFGIGQARRGWLEKADVLNALPLSALLHKLAPTMR